MASWKSSWKVGALLLCALSGSAARAAVFVNEFVYDAPGDDTGKEWVELYNTGTSTVSLEGWTLEVDDNGFPGIVKARLCGQIAPGGFYLIKEASDTVSASLTADVVSGVLAMGNASSKADGIQLLDARGAVQDRVVYGSPDVDGLCGAQCSNAPRASNGAGLCRSTPGASGFVAVSSSALTPAASGGPTCVYHSCPPGSGWVKGVISEAAPSIPNGDFVELYFAEGSNLCGAKLYEGDRLIKTFPPVTPRSGPFGAYLVFHAGQKASALFPDETDASSDYSQDGVIDLYSDEGDPGLTGSIGDNLTLKNADDTVADFLSWSVYGDASYGPSKQLPYDQAVLAGRWAPACAAGDLDCYLSGSARWTNRIGDSIARRPDMRGEPRRSIPPALEDWAVGLATPGRGYGSPVQAKGALLEIFQSPFSPSGENGYSQALFAYTLPAGSRVTIRIYDLRGRRVATVLDQVPCANGTTDVAAWPGRDDQGRTVPAGLYIVHLQADLPGGGKATENGTVVVGRPL